MGNKTDVRRRWLGAIYLALALGMLIAGQTVLRNSFGPVGFVIFWLVCLVFTCLAILVAFLDLSAVRRRTREEQRDLIENTLKEIARQKEARAKKASGAGGDPR